MTTYLPSAPKVISEKTTTKVEIDSQTGIETTIVTTTTVEEEELVNETYINKQDEVLGERDSNNDSSNAEEETIKESYILARFPQFNDIDGVGLEDLLYTTTNGPDKRPLIEFSGIQDRSPTCVIYSYGEQRTPMASALQNSVSGDTLLGPPPLVPIMMLRGRWKGNTDVIRKTCGQTDICVIRYEEEGVTAPSTITGQTKTNTGDIYRSVYQAPVCIPSFKVHADDDFLLVARRAADMQRRQMRSGRGKHTSDRASDISSNGSNEEIGTDSLGDNSVVNALGIKRERLQSLTGSYKGSDDVPNNHNEEADQEEIPSNSIRCRTRIYPISAILEMEMI